MNVVVFDGLLLLFLVLVRREQGERRRSVERDMDVVAGNHVAIGIDDLDRNVELDRIGTLDRRAEVADLERVATRVSEDEAAVAVIGVRGDPGADLT